MIEPIKFLITAFSSKFPDTVCTDIQSWCTFSQILSWCRVWSHSTPGITDIAGSRHPTGHYTLLRSQQNYNHLHHCTLHSAHIYIRRTAHSIHIRIRHTSYSAHICIRCHPHPLVPHLIGQLFSAITSMSRHQVCVFIKTCSTLITIQQQILCRHTWQTLSQIQRISSPN